jgi:LysM repeat protein
VTTPGGKLKSNTKYAVKKSPAVPEFSPGTGTYSKAQSVAITDGSAGSMILYTTDGTPPATSSTALVYTGPIKVKSTETLEAVAVGIDDEPSAVAAAVYTIL